MRIFSVLTLFVNLLTDPVKAWEKRSSKEVSVRNLFLNFVLWFVFWCALFVFFGVWIQMGKIHFAILQFLIVFVSLALGLFLAGKLMVLLAPNFMPQVNVNRVFQWVVYSATAFAFCHGLAQLFSPYSFLNQLCLLLELYFIRLLWIGVKQMLPVPENKRIGFVFLAGIFILVFPLICERILSVLLKSYIL